MTTIDYRDGVVTMIDQTRLPTDEVLLEIRDVPTLVAAIARLSVRGAPAIGVAGAFGVVLAARVHHPTVDRAEFEAAIDSIRHARPTAVNLARMVDRVASIARRDPAAAEAEAHQIRAEELAASVSMGDLGADLVIELVNKPRADVMTICNTGGLAAVERGTALAVVQTLHERSQLGEALPLETRPLLQGARLTAWELKKMGAPFRLLVDSAGPFLLSRGAADVVLIGADRIAANGDTANKIGSFSLALAARHAGVPFIVVAPESTVDMATASGDDIEIEDRGSAEVASVLGYPTAPSGTDAVNPAFDVTPVELITALVTNRRVVRFDQNQSLSS
ncbi:MAG: S-methyl-5-thioribose-1-phosphate isomerase [Actinomycetia bacterium]|nr:S-methyl-5-thioribose-1-phosphate isomerase [Actinomycetes bacterium]MCP4958334.1 S-methyl-5-thioribose-1-phosphate isomerase [Actinomycetes bacterium]